MMAIMRENLEEQERFFKNEIRLNMRKILVEELDL